MCELEYYLEDRCINRSINTLLLNNALRLYDLVQISHALRQTKVEFI